MNRAYMVFLDIGYSFGGPKPFRISGLNGTMIFLRVKLDLIVKFIQSCAYELGQIQNFFVHLSKHLSINVCCRESNRFFFSDLCRLVVTFKK